MQRTRVLVTGNWQADAIAEHMVAPFRHHRQALLWRHGIAVRFAPANTLSELDRVLSGADEDVVFALSDWSLPVRDTLAVFRRAARRPDRPALVYLDYFDQSSSPYFGLLESVDLYIKKQVYRDRDAYQRPSPTGFVFADYMAERQVPAPTGWHFGSPLPEAHAHKLVVGWNLATATELRRLVRASALQRVLPARRHIDVHCRVSLGPDNPDWWYYHHHRKAALEALRPLQGDYRVVSSLDDQRRIGYLQFLNELRHSKIGFSPFGWGELTYRDFQCIACDALLVKPDVSHLETRPDVFVPYETYVPVAWDLSDLAEKCAYYLAHAEERERIVRRARQRLVDYLRHDGARLAIVEAVSTVRHGPGAGASAVGERQPAASL